MKDFIQVKQLPDVPMGFDELWPGLLVGAISIYAPEGYGVLTVQWDASYETTASNRPTLPGFTMAKIRPLHYVDSHGEDPPYPRKLTINGFADPPADLVAGTAKFSLWAYFIWGDLITFID